MSKKIVSSFIEDIWIKHNLDNIDKYIAKDYVAFGMRSKITVNGVSGVKTNIANVLSKHPDCVAEIDDMFASGDKVATRLKFRPDPDSDLTMREIIIHEIKDDKITKAWSIGSDWN